MANFDVAFQFLMDSEDPSREYKITPDCGGYAISGVNSAAWPDEYAAIAATPQANHRAALVDFFYKVHFWNGWFEELASDEVAKRVFDAAVNMGTGTAVKLLQQAICNVTGLTLELDGLWGPQTVETANSTDPVKLVQAFKIERSDHYKAIVAKNPAKAEYLNLNGWLARAMK
jgi:type VI secretion system secreted protein VgrG